MKFKLIKLRTINIILISVWLLAHIGLIIINIPNLKNKSYYTSPINKLKPVDPPISQDLPYNQYEELRSQQRIARSLNNGNEAGRSSNLLGIIGTGSGDLLCDTCTIKSPIKYIPKMPRYYFISLRGWKLKSTTSTVPTLDSVIFHVEHGQAYTRKIVVSSETYEGEKNYTAEVKDIPVKFRYSHKSQMLKIPVSKHTTEILRSVFKIFTIIIVLYGLSNALLLIQLLISLVGGSSFALNIWAKSIISLILLPLFILYIVVKIFIVIWGDNNKRWSANEFVFTTYNISRLQILAYSLTCIPMFFIALSLLMRLIFSSYFTQDVVINAKILQPWSLAMDAGFILLLVLHVFRQGKALKEDQDLTV